MAKQARHIWTEKLGLVHPLPFSGVIFREIGHLAAIPIFWSNQCKKVQIIKHEWTPEIYKIKLYCIVEHLGGSGGKFWNLEPWKCDFLRFESNI